MPRLAVDLKPRPEMKVWRFIDASIKQFRVAYPELSYNVMSRSQEKTLRQYLLNTIMVVSTICHVVKPLFNIWHSIIWTAGNPRASFEASGDHALLPPPVAGSGRTPFDLEPERLPPTKFELSGHMADSFLERIELWRQHAEISDEPIQRWNEIIVGMIDVHHQLYLIGRRNFHLRLRLWRSIEADKRENMLYPGRNIIPDIDFTDFDPTEVDDASSEWDSVSTHAYDYASYSDEDSESLSEDDCDSTSEDDTLSTPDYNTDAYSEDRSPSVSENDAELTPEEHSDSAAENDAQSSSSDADGTSEDGSEATPEYEAHASLEGDADSASESANELVLDFAAEGELVLEYDTKSSPIEANLSAMRGSSWIMLYY